jgi:hypothetical protein
MTWLAMLTGFLGFTVLAAVAGPARRRPDGAGAWALQIVGGVGLAALAAAALFAGAFAAAAVGAFGAAALVVDPFAVARLAARRAGARRAAAASPSHTAM